MKLQSKFFTKSNDNSTSCYLPKAESKELRVKSFNLLVKVSCIESGDSTFLMHFVSDLYFTDVEEKLWEYPRSSLMLC